MSHEDQHEMLVEILTKLVPILSCDELSLLAFHTGIKVSEFYEQSNIELRSNKNERSRNDLGRVWIGEINQSSQSRPVKHAADPACKEAFAVPF